MGLEYVIKPNYGEFVDQTTSTGNELTIIKLTGESNLRGINVIIRTTLCTDDNISNTFIHIRLLGANSSHKVGFQYVNPDAVTMRSTLDTNSNFINLAIALTDLQITKLNSGDALMLHVSVRKGVNPASFTMANDVTNFSADMEVLSSDSGSIGGGIETTLNTCNRDYHLSVE